MTAPRASASREKWASALTVLVGDDLPELGTDLVTALASLDVNDLAHLCAFFESVRATDYKLSTGRLLQNRQ
jgi:hypothetical protein